jgi:hypothetical protein
MRRPPGEPVEARRTAYQRRGNDEREHRQQYRDEDAAERVVFVVPR